MVALMPDDDFDTNPKTLCEWVKNFRLKKIQMKRKLRGNLRVNAILSMALISAEHELRRKQHERFNRWLAMQSQMDRKVGHQESCHARVQLSAEDEKQQQEEKSLVVSATNASSCASECRQEEISNLWKSELSGLDQFMRNISSSSNNTSSVCS